MGAIRRTKTKRRTSVRALQDEPYNQKEADAAVNLRTDNGARKPSKLTIIEEQAATLKLDAADQG
ncbi:MAG: hypothetical protein Q9220_002088 [cf. Caloplaca sp. 1 TL-2023]